VLAVQFGAEELDKTHWNPTEGGQTPHVAAPIGEVEGLGDPGVPQLYGEFWSLPAGRFTGPKESGTLIPLMKKITNFFIQVSSTLKYA
jgi:hypothetical protein